MPAPPIDLRELFGRYMSNLTGAPGQLPMSQASGAAPEFDEGAQNAVVGLLGRLLAGGGSAIGNLPATMAGVGLTRAAGGPESDVRLGEVPTGPAGGGMSDEQAWALVQEHEPLIKQLARSHAVQFNRKQDIEDLVSEGQLKALGLAKRYDPSKGAFANFLSRTLSNEFKKSALSPEHQLEVGLENPETGEVTAAAQHAAGSAITPEQQLLAAEAARAQQPTSATPAPTSDSTTPSLGEHIDRIQQYIKGLTKPSGVAGREPIPDRRAQAIADAYFFKGRSYTDLERQFNVSRGTISKILQDAPSREKINIGQLLQQQFDPAKIDQAISSSVPESLQEIARRHLLGEQSPGVVARPTQRARPAPKDYLFDTISNILTHVRNGLK